MSNQSIYSFHAKGIKGEEVSLDTYRQKVLLIVNVASKCGFTPQYAALEKLYQKYKDQGFTVLAFPCNQFGHQEPGTSQEIADFCSLNFGVNFPIFQKIEVNGENTHPIYKFLKSQKKGLFGTEAIKWNFTKFLLDRSGMVVGRFGSATKPESLEAEVERIL